MRIVKTIQFDAAHFIDDATAAKAGRPYARMHGHSFTLEVELAGTPDAAHGWVVDFGDVTQALDELRQQLDHRLLNEIDGLEVPTLENICLWAAGQLQPVFPGLRRVSVMRPSNGEACHYDVGL